MPFIPTNIPDLFVFEPRVFEDERGYFFESFSKQQFEAAGLEYHFVQDNEAYSQRGVIRGLHYQIPPFGQAKLVRVIVGAVLDVVVDIRPGSATYGESFSIELSGHNKKQLLVPRGFAHGYGVISDEAIFSYKCDNFYQKSAEGGLLYSDPQLNIDWNIEQLDANVSEKDQILPILGQHLPYE